MLLLPVAVLANDCPNLLHKIDEMIAAKPDLDEETIVDEESNKNVHQLRNERDALHTA